MVVSDSERVMEAAYCVSYLTSAEVETGTDRVAEYINKYWGWDKAPDWIINVQGDMPFGTAPYIQHMISSLKLFKDADMVTPVYRLEIVTDADNEDFKRDVVFQHVGMYAYRKNALRRFYNARNEHFVRHNEKNRNLEQCRAVALGLNVITSVVTDYLPPLEINTQADLDRINEIVERTHAGAAGFGADERVQLALAGGG